MCIPCLDVESYYILPAAAGIACCPESATLQYLANTLSRNPCILHESFANVVNGRRKARADRLVSDRTHRLPTEALRYARIGLPVMPLRPRESNPI